MPNYSVILTLSNRRAKARAKPPGLNVIERAPEFVGARVDKPRTAPRIESGSCR